MSRYDFKVGDRVQFRPELTTPSFSSGAIARARGDVGTVTGIDSDCDLYVLFPNYEESALVSPSDAMRALTVSAESWEFHSASHVDIEYQEIVESLTRKNPIALIERGDKYSIAVKRGLSKKAEHCRLELPSCAWLHRTEAGTVYSVKQTDFAQWIAWAKSVKSAKWPKAYAYSATVKITTPTI